MVEEPWLAHGLCMDRECAYAGDMKWYAWDGVDTAICPKCGCEIEWEEMADDADQRDAIWKAEDERTK